MLDLKNMSDSEFCDVVTPPVKRAAIQVTLDKAGNVSLSGKLAEQLAGKPVEIRFNKARTAIQSGTSIWINAMEIAKSLWVCG